MAKQITEMAFNTEVLNSDVPVLVDFYAEWCMPCKMIAPFIDEIDSEMTGKAKVFKVDTDKAVELAKQYDVKAVPTLIYFKNGEVAERVTGGYPKEVLKQKLENLM